MKLFNDREFIKNLLLLSLPIALQNFIISSLNFIDNIMIGQLGEKAIAAVGIANQLFFLIIIFLFGISSGASVFMSQYWGAKEYKRIKNVLGISLSASCLVAALFSAAAVIIPERIVNAFTGDAEVSALAVSYLKTVSICYLFTAVSFTFSFALRSTERVNVPMVASVFSVFINIFLNYALIFGNYGFPELGVAGAALATVIARAFETVFMVTLIYIKKYEIAANIEELFSFDFEFVKKFADVAGHVVYNEIAWALGMVAYYYAYAKIGTESVAAVNIASSVERMAFVGFIGICHGGAVLIGKKIGENNNEKVFEYSRKLLIIAPLCALGLGAAIILFTGGILSLYKISPDVHYMAKNLIFILAMVFWVKMFNLIALVCILRSAGDTKFCFYLEGGAVWFCGVPLAFLGVFWLGLPIYFVYLIVNTEEIIKMIMLFWRYSSKKWIHNVAQA